MELRLDKYIASAGERSRREVKELVRRGRILVDGVPAAGPEQKVDPATQRVTLDGEELRYEEFTYVMLHKPAGVLSASEDRRARTVLDLLPPELRKRGITPVGRLDKDTEGLLLLTNDGALTHQLLSPKSHVDKRYYARVEGTLTAEDAAAFRQGIALSDFTCLPAELELSAPGECIVTVREGKFHQVKRMLASRGAPVTYLKRLSMGPLTLDADLPLGAWRPLLEAEIDALRCAVGKNIEK